LFLDIGDGSYVLPGQTVLTRSPLTVSPGDHPLPNRRTLELPKLGADDGTDLWDWLRLIAADNEEEIEMAVDANADLRQAADLITEFSADRDRRYEALAREKFLHDQATREYEGLQRGREEGLKQGREEGREEGSQSRAVSNARNGLQMGLPVEQVATITGLSVDEVRRLALDG